MSSPIAITGAGAVSPAGWGLGRMVHALNAGAEIPTIIIARPSPNGDVITPVLRVPSDGATTPKFARLRRASPISKFAAAAVAEALGEDRLAASLAGNLRVGVIFTLTNGCVNYSNRFFGEAVADPALASPILFPETVFNAPSSHISAMMGSAAPNDTLIGDSSGFFTGIDLAIEWLQRREVDGCVVVCAEEIDWLSAEGLRLYSRSYRPSEGAAAIYLEKADGPVNVLRLPDPVSFSQRGRRAAAAEIRISLAPPDDSKILLVDGQVGNPRFDRAESEAWSNWNGPRVSPRKILGEGMGVSAGWQTAVAYAALRRGDASHAVITTVGANQHAAGVLLGARR